MIIIKSSGNQFNSKELKLNQKVQWLGILVKVQLKTNDLAKINQVCLDYNGKFNFK